MKRIISQILNSIINFFYKIIDKEANRVMIFITIFLNLKLTRGGDMLIEFGLLNVFRFVLELKENYNSERRENEENDFSDNRINLNFNSESLCLR